MSSCLNCISTVAACMSASSFEVGCALVSQAISRRHMEDVAKTAAGSNFLENVYHEPDRSRSRSR
eukprot:598772-Amphidinium_carterae.1